MKTYNTKEYSLAKLLKKEHAGKWVAISSDYKKVMGYSNNLQRLEKETGTKDVVYIMGLSPDLVYSF